MCAALSQTKTDFDDDFRSLIGDPQRLIWFPATSDPGNFFYGLTCIISGCYLNDFDKKYYRFNPTNCSKYYGKLYKTYLIHKVQNIFMLALQCWMSAHLAVTIAIPMLLVMISQRTHLTVLAMKAMLAMEWTAKVSPRQLSVLKSI